jgi:hypothetical protein
MTDDRYTVDDPPEEGSFVYFASTFNVANRKVGDGLIWGFYDANDRLLLEAGLLHRTPESAETHASRMVMADDILEALEMLLRAQTSDSLTWREHVTRGARAVAKRARGEVAP